MKSIAKTKLTSVKIINEVYNEFKKASVDDKINLQQVVNRAINLYISDKDFRNKINGYDDLSAASGSGY
jgi:hypothetical protein